MDSSKIKIESGIQMLARLTKKPGIDKFYPIIFGNGPKQGDFIELYSEYNTSYLLIDLICEALIPHRPDGQQAGVIVFNTDGNLSYNSIFNLLVNKITKNVMSTDNAPKSSANDIDAFLTVALKNLFILEICDATQFYISIQNLENILSKHSNISLVVFHTLTAFYWSEQDFKLVKMDLYIKKLLHIIQKVVKDHKITVIYSRPEYFCSNKQLNNLESSCQNAKEHINYRIQILFNNSGLNSINVRACNTQFLKEFKLINDEITWV